jgi:dienelactone hydrolase
VALPSEWTLNTAAATSDVGGARFIGAWAGRWSDHLLHILIVETVSSDGEATVVSAIGDAPQWGIKREWRRRAARVCGTQLVVSRPDGTTTYEFQRSDRLIGTSRRSDGITSMGLFQRVDPKLLGNPGGVLPEVNPGEAVRIPHTVRDASGRTQDISLTATLYRARRTRSPLVVCSHGSRPPGSPAGEIYRYLLEARYFLKRGVSLLAPMRRGRGDSGGLSGEDGGFLPGLNNDSLLRQGIEEGVQDLRSVVRWASQQDHVDPGRILLVGQSRGGFLSVVYAGQHPDEVCGVINFVGGWMAASNSPYVQAANPQINTEAFAAAGRADGPRQLWLYADNDSFYPGEEHIRQNHAAFLANGGKAHLEIFHAVGENGHFLSAYPDLWQPIVDRYLDSLGLS